MSRYPQQFYYKLSSFEGTHTSYWWHPSVVDKEIRARIVGETKTFYLLAIGTQGIRKIKKSNISDTNPMA